MRNTLRWTVILAIAVTAIAAMTPAHAQSPAMELEGYYAAQAARLTALDARARAIRGMNLPAGRVPEARQPATDDAEPDAPSAGRDEASSPLIAHFDPPASSTRR